MRKSVVLAATALSLLPASAALAMTLPTGTDVPVAVPATDGIDRGQGTNAPGGANPVDPTAATPALAEQGPVGLYGDPTGGSVALQLGKEGDAGSVGRIGVHAGERGLEVYLEDYTDGDVVASTLNPVLDVLSPDADCPADGATCDAALVTLGGPVPGLPAASGLSAAALPKAPALPAITLPAITLPTITLPAIAVPAPPAQITTVQQTVTTTVGSLLGTVSTTVEAVTGTQMPVTLPALPAVPAPSTGLLGGLLG